MYKPLPDSITIKESPIEGLGLFATEKIKAHALIGVIHHPRKESEDGYIRTNPPITTFFHQKFETVGIIRMISKSAQRGANVSVFTFFSGMMYNPN